MGIDLPDSTPTDLVTPTAPLPSAAASRGTPGRSWKAEEDAKLMKAVKKHGKDWFAVAATVPGRTTIQCRKRWVNNLDPTNGKKTGKWTPEEDAKLRKAVKKHGKDGWVAVAMLVPARTNEQCRQRWSDVLDPANGKNLGKWSSEEDTKLTEAVKKHGKDWVAVAAMVPGRTNYQCRERWVNRLDPANRKNLGIWTPEDHAKLTEAMK
jgi:myb proto-oncogene protein